ncbi:MAG: T9SS type A sorting domain-containing protein [Bacteroidia bacterium]|nr:T9SS type A sorting domain-containing protein [Bacteroidia bacterium]
MRKLLLLFGVFAFLNQNTKAADTCKAQFGIAPLDDYKIQVFNISVGKNLKSKWSFDDGSYSILWETEHTYSGHSIKNVCLTINDSVSGCRDSICKKIEVQKCVASLTTFISLPTVNSKTLKFNASGIGTMPPNHGDYPYNMLWDFGDGGTSTIKAPTHSYAANGVYTVVLRTFDNLHSCTCITTQNVLVTPTTKAAFSNCQNGLWSDKNTWVNGHIPAAGDSVYLYHDIVLDQDYKTGKKGFVYIDNDNYLCGHHKLTGAVLQFGDMNIANLTVDAETRSISDAKPMNISGVFEVICCMDAWSFPANNDFECQDSVLCASNHVTRYNRGSATISPQPIIELGRIDFLGDGSSTYHLKIVDMNGKMVLEKTNEVSEFELSHLDLKSGVYICQITSSLGGFWQAKLMN